MVQTFYNMNPEGDIFNHANVHFWEYSQTGYDALGLISCTGTNFLLRSKAFQQVWRREGRVLHSCRWELKCGQTSQALCNTEGCAVGGSCKGRACAT